MTTKLEKAARQLLFVVTGCAGRAIIHPDNEAITAPQPVSQEPVAKSVMELIEQLAFEENGRYFIADDSEVEVTDIVLQIRNLLAAPVRTKDLTDRELADVIHGKGVPLGLFPETIREYRLVIAADREKNRG